MPDGVTPTREELLAVINGQAEPKAPETEEVSPETPTPETPKLSSIEEQAVAQGWQTKEDWVASGKDPDNWRDATSWVDRGQFFQTISNLRNELQATKQQVAQAFETGRRLAAQKAQEEIAALKEIRKDALREGDFDKAEVVTDKIDKIKEEAAKPAPQVQQAAPPPEFNMFVQRNPWYMNDPVLHHTADGLGYEFYRRNPNASPADLYFFVETKMREKFPELNGPKPKMPPSPERGSTSPRPSAPSQSGGDKTISALKADMNEVERGIMKTLIQTKVFKNEEEYLKEYAKAPARRR